MKKLLVLTAFVCGFLVCRTYAGDERSTPEGRSGSSALNADYGGVDIWETKPNGLVTSTVAIPDNANLPQAGQYGYFASTTTANNKSRWTIYGAYFSTGNCGATDFLEVASSTGGFVATVTSATVNKVVRFYNLNGSTSTVINSVGGNAVCGGFTPLRWPVRMYGNLYMTVSNLGGYLSQGVLYYKEPD